MRTRAAWVMMVACTCACARDEDGPVTFSNMRVEELGARRAVVRFSTSRPTSCEVEWGTAATQLDGRATDPDMEPGARLVDHEVPLEDLAADTEHFARAVVTDDSGTFRSDVVSFRTLVDGTGSGLVNHALGAVVSATSSNYGYGDMASGFGGNRAIDGQMATEWSTHGDGDAAFIEITLPAPTRVERIGFRSRSMTDGTSIIRRFEVTLDDGPAQGPFDAPDPAVRTEHVLPSPAMATRVRLQALVTTGGNTGAREVELLGP